jgi:hypothetical protein
MARWGSALFVSGGVLLLVAGGCQVSGCTDVVFVPHTGSGGFAGQADAGQSGAGGHGDGGQGDGGQGDGGQGTPDGQPCDDPGACASGHCADGVCCDEACDTECFTCSKKKGAIDDGACGPVPNGWDPDDDCLQEMFCGGNGLCQSCEVTTGKELGVYCAEDAECASLQCADGRCCDSDCTLPCFACSAAKTDDVDGVCTYVTSGIDPNGDCPDMQVCDGSGSCSDLS